MLIKNEIKSYPHSQYSRCPSCVKLEVVAHQGLLADPSTVHSLYCLPLYSNGNTQHFPDGRRNVEHPSVGYVNWNEKGQDIIFEPDCLAKKKIEIRIILK